MIKTGVGIKGVVNRRGNEKQTGEGKRGTVNKSGKRGTDR